MRGVKDLIARRRPTTGELDIDLPAPADTPVPDQTAEVTHDPWEALQEGLSSPPEPLSKHCDINSARAARTHVPRPERPQPSPRREWTPAEPEAALHSPDRGRRQSRPKVWDIDPDPVAPAPPPPARGRIHSRSVAPTVAPASPDSALVRNAALQDPQAARSASTRVKTRLLGFHGEALTPDVFASPDPAPQVATPTAAPTVAPASEPQFPIGWLVVVEGPGRGASFTLTAGLSTIGRDATQSVALDFGDTAISRERHVAIAYDAEDNRTYVGHGGKTNIVRLNDKPLLTTEDLGDGDTIKIGKTVLRFVAFCADGFSWVEAPTTTGARDA